MMPTPQQVVALQPQQLKKGARFTQEEDDLIRAAVARFGTNCWDLVAAQVPGRNAIQCRDRWTRHLAPGINKGPWTDEEVRLLIEKVKYFGTKWAVIAIFLSGRTDKDCRNRWYLLQRRAGNKSAIKAWQMQQVQRVVQPTVPPQPMVMQAPQFGFQPQVVASQMEQAQGVVPLTSPTSVPALPSIEELLNHKSVTSTSPTSVPALPSIEELLNR